MNNDNVNRPSHYTDGKIEVIDFIEDKKLGFHLGNAVKYISRVGKKDPDKKVEDLQKAIWYLEREIKGTDIIKTPAKKLPFGSDTKASQELTDLLESLPQKVFYRAKVASSGVIYLIKEGRLKEYVHYIDCKHSHPILNLYWDDETFTQLNLSI